MPSGTFAVLWDVDGTLVDTAELHFQAWCALAGELAKPFSRADFAGTFGWRNPEIIPRLFGTNYSMGKLPTSATARKTSIAQRQPRA